MIDSSVLVIGTRELILTVFGEKIFRSIHPSKPGLLSSWKMAIPFMELNFMKGFCPFSMEVIFFNFFFFRR